jgi:hypothetical protein
MGANAAAHASSFRDPAGTVLIMDGRVFRTVEQCAIEDFDAIEKSGILVRLSQVRRVVSTRRLNESEVPPHLIGDLPVAFRYILEHERIPFISYSYEWPFTLLKRAALHYLNLHIDCLSEGFTFSDASSYNVQFLGVRPIYIDVLSIRQYKDGECWLGYRQFCEQFLNPLLLTASTGLPYQPWLRSSVDGLPVELMPKVLPFQCHFSWRSVLHVYLHARLASGSGKTNQSMHGAMSPSMSKETLIWQLRSMHNWMKE